MEIYLGFVYLIGSILCGIGGSDREVGWFSGFCLALLCTPLIGFLVLLCSPLKKEIAYRASMLSMMKQLLENQKDKPQ